MCIRDRLDTLLTAKTLYCQQHGINLTCVADGTLLHFQTTGEICTIVGTQLDLSLIHI